MIPLLIAGLGVLLTVALVTVVGRWAARRHAARVRREMHEERERDPQNPHLKNRLTA